MPGSELHEWPDIVRGRKEADIHPGFAYLSHLGHIRKLGGIVHLDQLAIGQQHLILDAGGRSQQVKAVLTLQALLNDLHMEQAQKAAAKAHVQRHGGFGLEHQ